MKQMVGAHPDLHDDGIVDDLDLSLLKETTAETYGGEVDTAVDLDGDGSADFDDVVILLQNINVISEGASTSLLPDLGPNEEGPTRTRPRRGKRCRGWCDVDRGGRGGSDFRCGSIPRPACVTRVGDRTVPLVRLDLGGRGRLRAGWWK